MHCIRNKGHNPNNDVQTYNASNPSLVFKANDDDNNFRSSYGYINYPLDNSYQNHQGYKLLLMGGYNLDGDPVLENGGNKFEYSIDGVNYTEPEWENCYGTTVINTSLTLGIDPGNTTNCILAIDGITRHDGNSNHKIETMNNCKILANGYLKDVSLKGTLKIDELKVVSSNNERKGNLSITKPNSSDTDSDIFGKVELLGSSYVEIKTPIGSNLNSKLTLHSGAK